MINHDLHKEASEQMKELIKSMNGLSEEGFLNKYRNDPYFHRGMEIIIRLFMKSKED